MEARVEKSTVQFLDSMFGPQSRNLERSLDRATQRHTLLIENLANVNVPGYKRKDVEFGIELEKAQGELGSPFDNLHNRLGARPFQQQGSIRVDGNSVDMEQEVANVGETELRYQMLTEMTSRYFGGLKNVIKEGR